MEKQKTKKIEMWVIEPESSRPGCKVTMRKSMEEIPDLGREHDMCNICGWSTYPECMKDCRKYLPADEQRRLAKLEGR